MEIFRSKYNSDRKCTDVFRKSKITSFFLFKILEDKGVMRYFTWFIMSSCSDSFKPHSSIFDQRLSSPALGKYLAT